jgi:hypothetical protein
MVVTHYHNISTKSSELSAVAGGQCHALTYVLNFCHKTRYDEKTPMMMATSKKLQGGDQGFKQEREMKKRQERNHKNFKSMTF